MIISKELYKKIASKTLVDYSGYDLPSNKGKEIFVTEANALCMLEDLLYEIGVLEEKIEDIEQDIHDNYKRIEVKDQLGDL